MVGASFSGTGRAVALGITGPLLQQHGLLGFLEELPKQVLQGGTGNTTGDGILATRKSDDRSLKRHHLG